MKAVVRVPRGPLIDVPALVRVIHNTLDAVAKDIKIDFQVTTKTWKHKPQFNIHRNKYTRSVSTDSDIYKWVDEGTEPHIIRPKNGKVLTWIGANYRAKSKVRTIGSNKGGNDNTIVYTNMVQHPGTEARDFAQVIAEKWREKFPEIMQRAIDSEVE